MNSLSRVSFDNEGREDAAIRDIDWVGVVGIDSLLVARDVADDNDGCRFSTPGLDPFRARVSWCSAEDEVEFGGCGGLLS